jgi:hypothetical protein
VEPAQLTIQWMPGALSTGIPLKRPEHERDNPEDSRLQGGMMIPSSVQIWNPWMFTFTHNTPRYAFMA